jgi:iron complex outermembrane recepter protein
VINPKRFLRQTVRLALATAAGSAAPLAVAQTAPAEKEAAPAVEEVVVTGSRIAAPQLEAISPVTAVTAQEIKDTGVTRIEDLLNSLPQVVADQGSGLSMASNGTANINLRGLGVQRTLVLVNGRRLVGGDPGAGAPATTSLGYASAADVNQIPVAMIERVDVLTGGASSTYGADAVAGVVNFIMMDHFEGVRLDATQGIYNHDNHNPWINPLLTAAGYQPVTGTNWDGQNKDITLIMGHNFADGAGNFEGYLGYRRASPITADHRDHAACVLAASPGSPYSCVGSSNTAPAVIRPRPTQQVCDPALGCTGTPGTFVNQYNTFNFAASHYLQRIDERYTAGFFGHLRFNDHVEAYTEFMFMDDQTRGNYAAAGMFFGSGFAIDPASGLRDGRWYINCGTSGFGSTGPTSPNPYLSLSQYNTLCAPGSKYGVFPNPINGDVEVQMARRNIEGGPRQDTYTHTSWRGVFGARGEISTDWTYDSSFTFSKTRFTDYHTNDTSSARMQNALLAVKDPAGNIVCRGGQTGCVPWNIFDPALGVSPASLAYFSTPGLVQGDNEEDIFNAFVTGDLTHSGLKLPTANEGLKLVLGTEYRRDTVKFSPDQEFISADLAGIGSPVIGFDAYGHVWEGFTELRLPLVNDVPGIKVLDLEAGYRYSSYTQGFDTNTYKIGLNWAPISDVRLRASYNQAVRVPNLAETYKPIYVGLDSGGDLCTTTTYTQAQCDLTNYGRPLPSYPTDASPAQQYNGQIGGNPHLKPETGKTTNVGIVLTPSFAPAFSATIDFTEIKLSDAITSFGPNLIQLNCILSGSATSSWCVMVHRDPSGTLWASPQGYTIDPLINLAQIENRSIDVGMSYRSSLGRGGGLRFRLDGTYLDQLKYTIGGGSGLAPYDCAGKFGPSCVPVTPKWRHRFAVDWDTPAQGLSFGATWRYFGPADNSRLDPNSPDYGGAGLVLADARIPSISYLDLRASYAWNKLTVRLGCNNVLDKDPPIIDILDSGGNSNYAESNTFPSVYDTAGRFLYVNLTVDF